MGHKAVLLVEHEREHEERTLHAIAEARIDADVVVSRDGAAALDYLIASDSAQRTSELLPDLVLLALALPKIDGLEVIRRLRRDKRTELLPIVVFTTSRNDSDIVDAYLMGANAFVRKPRDPAQYRQLVQQICTYWLTINVPAPRRR